MWWLIFTNLLTSLQRMTVHQACGLVCKPRLIRNWPATWHETVPPIWGCFPCLHQMPRVAKPAADASLTQIVLQSWPLLWPRPLADWEPGQFEQPVMEQVVSSPVSCALACCAGTHLTIPCHLLHTTMACQPVKAWQHACQLSCCQWGHGWCCTTISRCGSARWERVGAVPEHVRVFLFCCFWSLRSNTGAYTRQSADWQTLVNWCKSYGLASLGNKATLKNWLRGFSRDRDQWERWALRQLLHYKWEADQKIPITASNPSPITCTVALTLSEPAEQPRMWSNLPIMQIPSLVET